MRRLACFSLLVLSTACGSVSGNGGGDPDAAPGPDGGGGGDDPDGGTQAACADITDEYACRERADCVTDTCFQCSCDPVFAACRAPEATPYDCPDLGCPMPPCCQTDADCGGATSCAPPGTDPGCGVCFPDPGNCTTDADCAATPGQICEPIHCSCKGAYACTPGCTDSAMCDEGETCDVATYRCRPTQCPDGACPPNFSCSAGPTPICQRTTCTGDEDCLYGWCVTGACYSALGECWAPPP